MTAPKIKRNRDILQSLQVKLKFREELRMWKHEKEWGVL